jgi:hypothetical protein
MMRRGEIMKEMSRRRCITDDEMNRGERDEGEDGLLYAGHK